MTSDNYLSCEMDLDDPSRNPLLSIGDNFPIFQQDESLLANEDSTDSLGATGIAAADVSSLLEQFEEASNSLGEFENKIEVRKIKVLEQDVVESTSGRSTPTKDIVDKIKAKQKGKSAILLPMGMPSKRGRGRATTLPQNCATPRMQRILMQVSGDQPDQGGGSKDVVSQTVKSSGNQSNQVIKMEVSEDYFLGIMDHDYCVNVPKVESVDQNVPEPYPEDDVLILEDGEVLDEDMEEEEDLKSFDKLSRDDSGIADTFCTSERTKQQRARRNYRGRRSESPVEDSSKYFNKIPSYYTALSLNAAKPPKKSNSSSSINSSSLNVQDFFEPNPAPKSDSTVYNKLPAYYSCFTNSTKYDNNGGDFRGTENSQESKHSSGYSSRNHSPSFNDIRSRSSRDRSIPRARSRSSDEDRYSRSRGRYRQRRRRGSYSSSSRSRSRSSSASSYYRSRSRSLSRSRSPASSDYSSRSRSRSYSRSRSRSHSRSRRYMSSRSRSREREREERKKIREEEKLQQMKERRIIYVGKIPENYTKRQMRRRFERFGAIEEVSVHFRENGDNYGFVTFEYRCDAFAAVEKGNDVPGDMRFDLCFGGRRQFCEEDYADLDGINEVKEEYYPLVNKKQDLDFDELLRQAKAKKTK